MSKLRTVTKVKVPETEYAVAHPYQIQTTQTQRLSFSREQLTELRDNINAVLDNTVED
jgi:hypothetical protein